MAIASFTRFKGDRADDRRRLITGGWPKGNAKKNSRPTFKPKPFLDGSGWHVDAEWPDGVTQHVDDFGSSSEAREWIAKKSEAWLQKHPIPGQPE
jgi:hypothetical protein